MIGARVRFTPAARGTVGIGRSANGRALRGDTRLYPDAADAVGVVIATECGLLQIQWPSGTVEFINPVWIEEA